MTDKEKKWYLPTIKISRGKTKVENIQKQEEISQTLQTPKPSKEKLDENKPRTRAIEKQKEVVDAWVESNPESMPDLINKIIIPSIFSGPKDSLLDPEYLLDMLDKLLDGDYIKKRKYFNGVLHSIDNFVKTQSIPEPIQDKIFQTCLSELPNGYDSLKAFIVHLEKRKINQKKYNDIIIGIFRTDMETFLSEKETFDTYMGFLEKSNSPADEYQRALNFMTGNAKMLKSDLFYNKGMGYGLSRLLEKGAILDDRYQIIIDLLVDDFLEGKSLSLTKKDIQLALRAVKQGKLDQAYYDKVMKAGMELLVTS